MVEHTVLTITTRRRWEVMAKPITGIPPFRGKAAELLTEYLENAKPDPRKAERAKEDRKVVERSVSLEDLRRRTGK